METQEPQPSSWVAGKPEGLGSCPFPDEARGSSSLDGGSAGPLEGGTLLSGASQAVERQDLALALLDNKVELRPEPADSRELVPAQAGVSSGLEQMFVQVLEENMFLRMRLEQADAGSSWHSQGTRLTSHEGPPGAPFSEALVQTPVVVQGRVDVHTGERAISEDLRRLEARTSQSGVVGRHGDVNPYALRPAVATPGWELGSAAESLRVAAGQNSGRPYGVQAICRGTHAGNECHVMLGKV